MNFTDHDTILANATDPIPADQLALVRARLIANGGADLLAMVLGGEGE